MAGRTSGCASTLAFIVSFVIATGVVAYQQPVENDLLLLVIVWVLAYFALMVLPAVWETVLLNVRRLRRR